MALALCVQCVLIGAPARERRLAAIRLARGAPRQTAAIAGGEAGLASLIGAVGALLVYLAIMAVGELTQRGAPKLVVPSDVRLAWWLAAAIVLGLPAASAGASVIAMRRVAVTPFGVVRRAWLRPVTLTPWPIVIVAVLIALQYAMVIWDIWVDNLLSGASAVLLAVLAYLPVIAIGSAIWASTGWISAMTGRLMYRIGRRPATLIAARRLITDPWSGARVFGTVLLGVAFGAFIIEYRQMVNEVLRLSQRSHLSRRRRTTGTRSRSPISASRSVSPSAPQPCRSCLGGKY